MTRYFTCQRCGRSKARTISTYNKYLICATCTRRLKEGGHEIPKREFEIPLNRRSRNK